MYTLVLYVLHKTFFVYMYMVAVRIYLHSFDHDINV